MTMRYFTIFSLIIAGLLISAPLQTQAQDLKIGVVDANLILTEMPELTNVSDQLEGFATRKRREFAQLETRFLEAREEFEQKVAVISESARQTEQDKLAELQREIQEFQMEYQQELLERQETLIAPLRTRIMDAINDVSSELELSYVLNRMVNNGDLVVLYISDDMRSRYDITNKVKQKLGIASN